MIPGVEIKTLVTHDDERGFFREIIRASDPFFNDFAQWSQSMKREGYYTLEFHIHRNQTDFWYVPFGLMRAVLCDLRHPEGQDGQQFEEYLLGDGQAPVVLKIPPGVAHGLKILQGPAHLFYITSAEYDPADEGRIVLDYDWNK